MILGGEETDAGGRAAAAALVGENGSCAPRANLSFARTAHASSPMRLQLALVLFQLTLAAALSGSLYTYANYNNTPGLYVIDPATGAVLPSRPPCADALRGQARLQCNLKAQNLPPLSSAAGAVGTPAWKVPSE